MGQTRGFRIGRKLVQLWNSACESKNQTPRYTRLNPSNHSSCCYNNHNRRHTWVTTLKRKLKKNPLKMDSSKMGKTLLSGFVKREIREEGSVCKGKTIPKGYLVVYAGQRDDDHRFLVPVVYCNHPLFGKLLEEAEEEYGYNSSGGLIIPCGVPEFECVKTKIASESCRGLKKR
ncbi:auxin-responsive protein SAUR36 [Amborella trichopoda]|uniref:Uncharacterized protein n=1 Tax=Amborella trichopoda TaxID=13333 RepID=W1P0Y9_AMBTC|nr:auxin-responsive protein SAUR36 [Amborella trichopoda]ERN01191.1 hypothetical protein AMTR_s00002p00232820 [Amborella trichopoda]|eukprot:XP_006838622.1 auxin-responsive protein SAUR36 [Amborella trichopoda]